MATVGLTYSYPPEAEVQVFARTGGGHEDDLGAKPLLTAETDRDGQVELSGLPEGPVWVVCGQYVQAAVAVRDAEDEAKAQRRSKATKKAAQTRTSGKGRKGK